MNMCLLADRHNSAYRIAYGRGVPKQRGPTVVQKQGDLHSMPRDTQNLQRRPVFAHLRVQQNHVGVRRRLVPQADRELAPRVVCAVYTN